MVCQMDLQDRELPFTTDDRLPSPPGSHFAHSITFKTENSNLTSTPPHRPRLQAIIINVRIGKTKEAVNGKDTRGRLIGDFEPTHSANTEAVALQCNEDAPI